MKPSDIPYNPYAPVPINSNLYKPYLRNGQLPIVYRDKYNSSFTNNDYDREANISKEIIEKLNLDQSMLISPNLPTNEDLRLVHSNYKLYKFNSVGPILYEILLEDGVDMNVDQSQFSKRYINTQKYQTAGTILAGKLAMQYGWSINIGGGFNTSTERYYKSPPNAYRLGIGATYADITLLVHYLFAHFPNQVKKVMIIDLDACPGYGIKCDFINRHDVFVLDIYNGDSYYDLNWQKSQSIKNVKAFTSSIDQEVDPFMANSVLENEIESEKKKTTEKDNYYLNLVEKRVKSSLDKFLPDFVVYIAGTNILRDHYHGGLLISKEGLLRRDEIVFENVRRKRNIPIAMLMGTACPNVYNKVYADSINNLKNKKIFEPIWH